MSFPSSASHLDAPGIGIDVDRRLPEGDARIGGDLGIFCNDGGEGVALEGGADDLLASDILDRRYLYRMPLAIELDEFGQHAELDIGVGGNHRRDRKRYLPFSDEGFHARHSTRQ